MRQQKQCTPTEFNRGCYLHGILDTSGIPLKSVAIVSGLPPSTVSRFFTGSRSLPEAQQVQIILTVGKLITRHNPK